MARNDNGPAEQWGPPLTPPDPELDDDRELDLDATPPPSTDPAPPAAETDWFRLPEPDRHQHPSPRVRRGAGHGLPVRGWVALAALIAVTIGMLAATRTTHQPGQDTGTGASLAAPAATTTTGAGGACAGLSGPVVTDRSGDTTTVAGVIAAFEAAYYIGRSAEEALRVVAPEAGITAQALADGIASIPAGTTHCVAITPLGANTANVHIVEMHPDGQRMDYLQVVNTRPTPGGGLLIINFQAQS
ncbi:hypothetical protein [Nocardia blacklockiae]|uniref:hypothetical protein n=1 Tax=Nocardia blacklockiae TaxID=480036 RepID=UPI0018937324|nr:hypothetical protein [Nocardia blacklockiae]MBF6176795.1 hypothetical protein [Nocardia blacklockiae]